MRLKVLAIASVISLSIAGAAMAGNATLKKGDKKMRLFCDNSGCYTQDVLGAFKYGKRNRIGPGGSANFNKHKAKYGSQGWN